MALITRLKIAGVATHKNRMSEVREGALAVAESILIDRESLAEPRRGNPFEDSTFSSIFAPGDTFGRLIAYGGKILAHGDGALKRQDAVDTWTPYVGGSFDVPDVGFRVHDAQANGSLYMTSDVGIQKLDDVAGSPRLAGTPRPLDLQGSLTGSSGYLEDDTAVGYKSVLYYTDAQGVDIVSAPSATLVVQNTVGGGATRNVALTCYIPSGLSTSYYWKVFRSEQTEDADDPPSDELQLVASGQLSSANISAGSFTVTDSTPDSLRGEKLYTSPSLEGPAQANDQPPLARDICSFLGLMLYANVTGKHRFFLNLLGTGTTALRFVSDNVATTNLSAVVTSVATTTTLRVGMKVKAAVGIPSTARILSIDSGTQITMTVQATATGARDVEFQDVVRVDTVEYFAASATVAGSKEFLLSTSGTASQNIENTARAFGFVVNQNASARVFVFYDSPFDGFPGQMRIEERAIGGAEFQLSSTATEAFSPTLPSTDSGAQVSLADRRPNFLVPSKDGQPESVPIGSGFPCGTTPIRRVLALRESAIVLSDVVGILSGTGRDNISYSELDSTTRLIAPESAVVVNDAVYAMSNQGVVRISPQGVTIASRDIERDLIRLSRLSNFATLAFAVGYETDRSFILAVPTDESDTQCTFIWRYHAFTDAWTHAIASVSCGVVDPSTDQLLLADQDASLVRRERKTFTRTDYADDALTVAITSSSGTTVNLSDASLLLPRDLLVQGANEVRIASLVGNALTMASTATWSNGAATAYRPIDCVIELLPFTGGEPALMKQFTELHLVFREAEFLGLDVAFANDFFPNFDYGVTVGVADPQSAWSDLPMGSDPQNEQIIRVFVPREVQRCHWMRARLTFSICRESMAFAGYTYKTRAMSSRFRGANAA